MGKGGRGGRGWLAAMLPTRRKTVLWPFPSQSVAELAELEESGRLWW